VTATKSHTHEVDASITGTVEFDAGVLLATAKTTFSITVGLKVSGTETYSAVHYLENGAYGHIQWVVWGYKIRWTKWRQHTNCTATNLGQGTASFPNPNNQGYRTWDSWSSNGQTDNA
jgi:hypothetical protein